MKKFKAKDYINRDELEKAVSVLGLTPDLKPEYEIVGKREELERLKLNDTTLFYGIKCTVSDFPFTPKPQVDKIERGEKFISKLE